MRWTRMLLLMVVATFAITGPASAATYNVNTTDDVLGDCPSTCSIRGAIAAANADAEPDTIVIPAGQYSLTQTIALRITNPVTLTGAGASQTKITANPSVEIRALEIANASASVADLSLQGGKALFGINGPHGGTLMAQSSTVTLTRVHVFGGSALSGGGIANRNGQMTIDQSLISNNLATQGGGDGGGIINFGGDGGNPASLTIRNSTIAFNTARLAGGLISYGNPQNTVTTTGVTIAQNHAGDRGTGAVQIGEGSWSAQLTLIADNFHEQTSSNCSGTKAVSDGWNVETSDGECGFTLDVDKRVLDAKLSTSLADNGGSTPTMAPAPGSPAIDIRTTACDGVDQRGVLRPKGAGCDAGAFETTYWIAITGGPEGGTRNATPTFTFGSTEGADGYRCRLKGRDTDYTPCTSPYTVTTPLPNGVYSFQVEALLNGQGQAIAERSFTLDTQAPPAPVVTAPANNSFVRDVVVTFSGTAEPNAFIRILDAATGAEIDSTNADATGAWLRVSNLAAGQHDLNVVASDAVGDSDPTPVRVTIDVTRPVAQIDSGPTSSNGASVTYTYSADEPAAFTCRLVGWEADAAPCPATGRTYTDLPAGDYVFQVSATDRAGNQSEVPATRNLTIDGVPTVITAPAADTYTTGSELELTGTATPNSTVLIFFGTDLVRETGADDVGRWTVRVALPNDDGAYTYRAQAGRAASADVRVFVDRTAPTTSIGTAPLAVMTGPDATFSFASNETGITFACSLAGGGRDPAPQPCNSGTVSYDGLTNGEYEFQVRATDRAGNTSVWERYGFTVNVTSPGPVATQQTPTPTPSPSPTPTATPTPVPDVGETVVTRPTQGKVFIKEPGTGRFVELKGIDEIPLNSEIDTKAGRVRISFETEDGKVQTAVFYGGIFVVRQVGKILDLKLSEPLAACPKQGKAAAAQTKKASKRKLWGDGKGAFRTSGKYSAATVRGTTWYVEDSCAGTLTKVKSGVVAVKDRNKTVLVRAGKQYLAKARR